MALPYTLSVFRTYNLISFCLLILLGSYVSGEVAEDEIHKLPGWSGPLPSRQFSGLIKVANDTKVLHYWLVLSEHSPAEDPLVLWLNGGPGASSLLGLFTELGPLLTNDDSTLHPVDGVPSLFYNPYSWATVANVLFLESPAGVGFSYCEGSAPCEATDESTADDTADFFKQFYQKYAEFKDRPLFLTGESYAGVYLPMLAERLIKGQTEINVAGMAVGNGCWGNSVGLCSDSGDSMSIVSSFFHAHSMYDDTLWDDMQEHCDWYNVTESCWEKVDVMRREMGSFFLYNIYDTCGGDDAVKHDFHYWFELTPARRMRLRPSVLAGLNDYKCGAETAMAAYLSNSAVAKAIHVKQNTRGMSYTRTVADLRPLYRWLSEKTRVLIYSGDVDGCVPTYGTETFFLRTLGMNITERWGPWHAYTMNGHYLKVGYHEKFSGTKNGIDFLTFNGAGHMVPQYKPIEALAMLTRWIHNQPLRDGSGLKMSSPLVGPQGALGRSSLRIIDV